MCFFQVARWVLAYHTECAESVDLMNLKKCSRALKRSCSAYSYGVLE